MSTSCTEPINTEKRECKPSLQMPPFVFDFLDTMKKIENLEKVRQVNLSYPSDSDMENLQIYVFTKGEDLDIEDQITKLITDWEIDYSFFPEFHIIPCDSEECIKEHLPERTITI